MLRTFRSPRPRQFSPARFTKRHAVGPRARSASSSTFTRQRRAVTLRPGSNLKSFPKKCGQVSNLFGNRMHDRSHAMNRSALLGSLLLVVGVDSPDIPVSDRDRVYAAEQFSNTIAVVDPASNKLLGEIRLGDTTPENTSPLYRGQVLVHG